MEIVATILEDEGYTVLHAYDGAAALSLVERERPDLLITDQMMPRLSGLDPIARLRERPDLAVSAILMSAVRPPAPPAAFLPKPFDLDQLLDLVGILLP